MLTRTHSIGTYVHDKWQVTTDLTLNLGLRYDLHISPLSNPYNPFFADPDDYPVDKNNFQPRVGFAYNMGGRSVLRGGYGLFYEKQWIDRFETYLLNRVFADSFIGEFPFNAADPGPSNGQFPTNPFLVNGPTVNRALLDQLVPPGSDVAQHRRRLPRQPRPHPAGAAPGEPSATSGSCGSNLSFAADYVHIGNRRSADPLQLQPGGARQHQPHRPDRRASTSSAWPTSSASRRSSSNVYTYLNMASSQYDGISRAAREAVLQLLGRPRVVQHRLCARQHQRAADRGQRLPGARRRAARPNDGPTNFDRRHTLSMSGRLDLPVLHGVTLAATARMMSGSPFSRSTTARSTRIATAC